MRVQGVYLQTKTLLFLLTLIAWLLLPLIISARGSATGGYPYASATDCSGRFGVYSWCMAGDDYISPLGYAYRNCTDWTAWMVKTHILGSSPTGLGNGGSWDNNAGSRGYAVKTAPEPGDAAVWDGNSSNPFGHVAFVESVNANGSVNISEYNYGVRGQFGQRFGVRASKYVDFDGPGRVSYRPASQQTNPYVLTNSLGLRYTENSDIPIAGDWNGDGRTDIGVVRGNIFYMRSETGVVNTLAYGNGVKAGDIPIVGNWDGYPGDEVGVVQGNVFNIRMGNGVTQKIAYGNGMILGDIPIAGDWNGDGRTDIGVVRGNIFYMLNIQTGQTTTLSFGNGIGRGDVPFVADWNGDGKDEPGIYRENNFYGYSSPITVQFAYGNGVKYGDVPLVGNWDRDGGDDFGVIRGNVFYQYRGNTISFGNPVQASL